MVELGLAYGEPGLVRPAPGRRGWSASSTRRTGSRISTSSSTRDLGAVVRPYYGVDQADGDRLREIVAAEFRGEPIDLVVDDASHRYGATLASFETLFPLMRPGGLYVIEDWAGLHEQAAACSGACSPRDGRGDRATGGADRRADRVGRGAETPLSRLAIEFMLVQTSETRLIDDLAVNRYWIAVRRGRALPATGFRLADHYVDVFDMVRPCGRVTRPGGGAVPR